MSSYIAKTTEAYLINPLTNLHVGSGDTTYGVVDKLVQRDLIEPFPTIHASSLKGAFRQYFVQEIPAGEKLVSGIFGKGDAQNQDETIAGSHRFFAAEMLSFPVRSNRLPFFHATSIERIKSFLSFLTKLRYPHLEYWKEIVQQLSPFSPVKGKPHIFDRSLEGPVILEDFRYVASLPISLPENYLLPHALRSLFGENLALFHHEDLKQLCTNLPVLARNKLNNGQSVNVWYEEVVPRETRFLLLLTRPTTNRDFVDHLSADSVVQIGGNASVGCGYCLINPISSFSDAHN
ncbi:MAG: type III-B CRISPR module RAMP protein Cmr4 [Bacteroidota bacterium]